MNEHEKVITAKGKKLSYLDIMSEAYSRSQENNSMIKSILATITKQIKEQPESALVLLSTVRDMIDINVKNDNQLLKIADSIQKMILNSDDDGNVSDKEIFKILDDLENVEKKIQSHIQDDEIDELNPKETILIGNQDDK